MVKLSGTLIVKIFSVLAIMLSAAYFTTYYLNNGDDHAQIEEAIRKDAAIHSIVGPVQSIKVVSRTKVEASSEGLSYISYRANVQGERKAVVVKININAPEVGPPVIQILN